MKFSIEVYGLLSLFMIGHAAGADHQGNTFISGVLSNRYTMIL